MENVADPNFIPVPLLVLLVILVLRVIFVDNKGPPMRSCDSLGLSKLSGGDGAQESAIEVEQSQPGAVGMAIAGQHDHLVAVHRDVEDEIIMFRGFSGLNRGNDLQV